MTLVDRIRSWFVRQETGSIAQEARSIERIGAQHRRLGREWYFRGGASGWYRFWGKTPRVRTTLAQEALFLTAERQQEVIGKALAYAELPWWQKLFSPWRRDYALFLYFGGQRYLSTSQESEPLSSDFTRRFLGLLSGSRYAKDWQARFSQDDRLRLSHGKDLVGVEEAKLVSLKERLEGVSVELAVAQEEARRAKIGVQIASYTVSAAKAGDKTVISRMMISTQVLADQSIDWGKALLALRKQVLVLIGEVRVIQGLSSRQGASLVQLKEQVLRLGSQLSQASEAAEQEAKSMIAIGDQVYDDSGQVALDRLEESKVSLEKSKVFFEESRRRAEASGRRAEASGRRALAARQGLVQLLEQRSLRLDEAERRIRGMTKLSRLREPSAWTETDILRMRLQILDQAYRGGVYHFLWSSRVFQASPVFSSIFNPKRRKSEQDTVEDKRLPFN